jgi:hypothetical protein
MSTRRAINALLRDPPLSLKIALASVSVVLTGALAELVLRPYYGSPEDGATRLVATYYDCHDTLRWLPRKNIHGKHRKPGSFDTTFHTNSRGLRDREHPLAHPQTGSRIVAVGDSFTWGYGVEDDEAFPRVLEGQLLGARAGGVRSRAAVPIARRVCAHKRHRGRQSLSGVPAKARGGCDALPARDPIFSAAGHRVLAAAIASSLSANMH